MSLEERTKGNKNKPDRPRRGIKNDRIYRILLCDVEGTLTKYRIAKMAQAQQTQVSLLLRKLEKLHLVTGTRVVDPKGLLNPGKMRDFPATPPMDGALPRFL